MATSRKRKSTVASRAANGLPSCRYRISTSTNHARQTIHTVAVSHSGETRNPIDTANW